MVGYGGKNVPISVDSSQLLLKFFLTPQVDEGQCLNVCPGNTSSSLNIHKKQEFEHYFLEFEVGVYICVLKHNTN